MSWRYQVRKRTVNDEVIYELVEAYPTLLKEGDTIIPHTEDAVCFVVGADEEGEAKQKLAMWLRIAADDVEMHDIIDGDLDEKS